MKLIASITRDAGKYTQLLRYIDLSEYHRVKQQVAMDMANNPPLLDRLNAWLVNDPVQPQQFFDNALQQVAQGCMYPPCSHHI
jgi:hypothetical protein